MKQKEFEFRTDTFNLLGFKILQDEESNVFLSFKNGKREESISLHNFIEKWNFIMNDSNIQLQIVSN